MISCPQRRSGSPGKTISTELASDAQLISGLKSHAFQLAVLHENPEDSALFSQPFMEESLYLSISQNHELAQRERVSFADLADLHILMDGNIGFRLEICRSKLPAANLLIQTSFEAFSELVDASTLPLFNSSQFLTRGYLPAGRKSIPILDPEAHAVYRLACLASEQKRYRSIFSAVLRNVKSK